MRATSFLGSGPTPPPISPSPASWTAGYPIKTLDGHQSLTSVVSDPVVSDAFAGSGVPVTTDYLCHCGPVYLFPSPVWRDWRPQAPATCMPHLPTAYHPLAPGLMSMATSGFETAPVSCVTWPTLSDRPLLALSGCP